MLTRIQIEGYKSIRALDLTLGPMNVLIGANGSGKSNFLSFFNLLRHVYGHNLQHYVMRSGGPARLLTAGEADAIKSTLYFEGGATYHLRLGANPQQQLCVCAEGTDAESALADERLESAWRMQELARDFAGFAVYNFIDTRDEAAIKQPGLLTEATPLHTDGGNLAAFLYHLQQTAPEAFAMVEATMRGVAPMFRVFALTPDADGRIRLQWRDRASDYVFDAFYLSAGTLRMMCLAALLLQEDLPPTLLIDEPEPGLHPVALSILAGLVQSAAAETQVILSTQSTQLVNEFEPEEVVVIDCAEGRSTFHRLTRAELDDWLDDYTLGELWEKNILGGRP